MADKPTPPPLVLPPSAGKKAKTSYTQQAVIRRLLNTKEAKALGLNNFALWSNIAKANRIDTVDLIRASIATKRLPTQASVGALAGDIQKSVQSGNYTSIDAYLKKTYGVDTVGVSKAANVGTYAPAYGQTPVQKGTNSVADSAATKAIKSSSLKWIVYDPKTGKISTQAITSFDQITGLPSNPPKNGLYYGQTPVTTATFAQALSDLSDHFAAYGPEKASGVNVNDPRYQKQVAQFLYKGLTPTAIDNALSKQPTFYQSRAWKATAPAIIAQAKAVYGEGWKPDKDFVRNAIVQNWSQATLAANLKSRPEYLKGPEYKQATASLNNVHMSIMGTPDKQAEINVHEAALEGWSPDQYAAWIRSTDAYKYSPEAKAYSIGIAQQLGLITGSQGLVPVNAPGGAPQPPQENKITNSTRVAGAPTGAVSTTPKATPAPAKPKPKPVAPPRTPAPGPVKRPY